LFFEHDSHVDLASLKKTEKGVRINEKINVSDL